MPGRHCGGARQVETHVAMGDQDNLRKPEGGEQQNHGDTFGIRCCYQQLSGSLVGTVTRQKSASFPVNSVLT